MYRSATLAIVVSSTSMNVGMTTATATTQGLIAGRWTAVGAGAAWLTRGLLRAGPRGFPTSPPSPLDARRGPRGGGDPGRRVPGAGRGGALREGVERLQDLPGVRPHGRFLVIHVRHD